MLHPLDGAYERVKSSDKHLGEVLSIIETFKRNQYDGLFIEYDPVSQNFVMGGQQAARIPLGMSTPISDCIQNLRVALDYIVYELAFSDSGSVQDGTQFPIEDTVAGFDRRRKTYLKGLTNLHVDAIEAYQPYKGGNWTKTLRTLSNPDKHRHLTILNANFSHDFLIIGGKPGSFEGRPGKVFQGVGSDGCDVYVERQYTLDIAFSDGLPVLETLENLKTEVGATIDAFKPEFK